MMFFTVLIVFFLVRSEQQTLTENAHVPVSLTYPSSIAAHDTAELSVSFVPISGIHVNAAPMVELVLEKNTLFTVTGTPLFKRTDDGYLAVTAPVVFYVTMKRSMKPGPQTLKGKLNYFYCSDSDGWCNKFSQPITLRINIHK